MIRIADTPTPEDGYQSLTSCVLARLPHGYPLTQQDKKWLQECGNYLEGETTNGSVLAATKKAFEVHGYAFTLTLLSC